MTLFYQDPGRGSTIANQGALAAILVIVLISALCSTEQFLSWGWRIPFLLSLVVIFIIGYIRLHFIETVAVSGNTAMRSPVLTSIKSDWQAIIKILCYMATANVLFFSFTFYSAILIEKHAYVSLGHHSALWIEAIGIVFFTLFYPLMGYLSDIYGRRKMVRLSLISLIILCTPVYGMIIYGGIVVKIIGAILLGIAAASIVGTFVPLIVEQAKNECRVSTVGLGHGLSILIFGSTAPVINEVLISVFKSGLAPSYYIVLLAFLSLVTLFYMQSTDEEQTTCLTQTGLMASN